MRKEITVKIPYFEKGKELEKDVKISFISNRVVRDYNQVMKRLNESLSYYGQINEANKAVADIIASKDIKLMDKRNLAKPYGEEIKELKRKIKEADEDSILSDRFEIIKRILEDNDIKDPDLLLMKFWDDKTEASTSWSFLTQAVMKDTPTDSKGKKKSMNLTSLF